MEHEEKFSKLKNIHANVPQGSGTRTTFMPLINERHPTYDTTTRVIEDTIEESTVKLQVK